MEHLSVTELLGSGDGDAYLAVPSASHPLWLLPLDRRLQRSSLRLYAPQRWVGRARKQLVQWGLYPRYLTHASREVSRGLKAHMARETRSDDVNLAFALGVPGAYRKITVQVMSKSGQPIAIAKLPATELAGAAVQSEHDALSLVGGMPSLSGAVPKVISYTGWRDVPCLIMSAGPPRAGPRRFGALQLNFLAALHSETKIYERFERSGLWVTAIHTNEEIRPHIAAIWRGRLGRAMETLNQRLAERTMPLSFAHRDFTPWNTCVGPEGFFVFDWEAARSRYPPFFDVIHFHAAQKALISGKPLRDRVDFLSTRIETMWHDGGSIKRELMLAYLLDQSLYYAKARTIAPSQGDERMLTWMGDQLDELLENF